jgi:WD40 repeat protein
MDTSDAVLSVCFSPNNLLAAGMARGDVVLWDITTFKLVAKETPSQPCHIFALKFDPVSSSTTTTATTSGSDCSNQLIVYSTSTDKLLKSFNFTKSVVASGKIVDVVVFSGHTDEVYDCVRSQHGIITLHVYVYYINDQKEYNPVCKPWNTNATDE